MKRRYVILLALGALVLAGRWLYGWWNPDELVTFHGKDAPAADALKSFSRQTGRVILFPDALDAKVSLNLEKVPLEDAIEAAAGQANLRHERIFLLYGKSAQRDLLVEQLKSQTEPPVLMRFQRARRWEAAETNRQPGRITYRTSGKAAAEAVAEVNLASDSYFYLLDDDTGPVTVEWKEVPIRQAAEELAGSAGARVERIYQCFSQPRWGDGERGGRDQAGRRAFPPLDSPEELNRWKEETDREIAALPEAERAAAEAAWREQEKRIDEFAAMSPQQRMEAMMRRFNSGDQEQRLIRRLKNSTPEQRAQRYQRIEKMREARNEATPAPAPLPGRPAPGSP